MILKVVFIPYPLNIAVFNSLFCTVELNIFNQIFNVKISESFKINIFLANDMYIRVLIVSLFTTIFYVFSFFVYLFFWLLLFFVCLFLYLFVCLFVC